MSTVTEETRELFHAWSQGVESVAIEYRDRLDSALSSHSAIVKCILSVVGARLVQGMYRG